MIVGRAVSTELLALPGSRSPRARGSHVLGCEVDELREYLIALGYRSGEHMHLDHIRPCSSFDLTQANGQAVSGLSVE